MTPEQFRKLPKFAQEHIDRLTSDNKHLLYQLELQQQDKPTRVRWGYPERGQAYGFLCDRETIHFTLLEHPRRDIRVRLTEYGLNINGDTRIAILGGASNDCTIRIEPQ